MKISVVAFILVVGVFAFCSSAAAFDGSGEKAALIDDDLEIIELPGPAVRPVGEPEKVKPVKPVKSEKPAIAVLPFKVLGESVNMGAGAGAIICDAFVTEIDSQQYEVFERQYLKELLEEKGFQESMLVDSPQGSSKFGKLSRVDYVVIGTISKLGGSYALSARLVDCVNGNVERRKRVEFKSIRQWPDKVAELAGLLSLRSGTENVVGNGSSPAQITGNDLIDAVNPASDFAVTIKTAGSRQVYFEGEFIKFVVSAERDCYVTLVTVDSDGQMSLLLPNKWQKSAFVRVGKELAIPSKEMGFRFPIKPPHGETIVKAIATFSPLRLSGVDARSIDNAGFMKLDAGVKAIGVEAAVPEEYANITGLAKLLKPGQWTTDELIVMTASRRYSDAAVDDNFSATTQKMQGTEFDYDYIGVDISDRIFHRYKQLRRRTLTPSQLSLNRSDGRVGNSAVDGYLVFSRGSDDYIKIAAERLGEYKDSGKYVVAPNIKMYSMSLPATRLSEVQWALRNRFAAGNDLGVLAGYEYDIRKPAVLIGLVDGPVDWGDRRISGSAWVNRGEIAGNGIDDDGNGFVDDVRGWNFTEGSNLLCRNPQQFNHGTALVSVMASRALGEDHDVIGVAPQAKIVTAVVLSAGDLQSRYQQPLEGDLGKVIDAIKYVAGCGAKVINCSFGTYVTAGQLSDLSRIPIWRELENKGVVIICAAGNDNVDIDRSPVFPASLPRGNIIAVGATDAAGKPGTYYDKHKKQWIPFTNYGERTVDISGPGTLILAGGERGKTVLCNGTSYSAAMVTALKAVE
ncbi:MAG: S8 family serine peptidase [Phycisphaerae bacterium]|nr:S8 family serine peptidase [Phycisphaerae bacterium]